MSSATNAGSAPAVTERPERVDQPERAAAPGHQGQTIGYREFVSAVQEVGAIDTAAEAERAAVAVLGELGGCLSWPVAQNLAAGLPRPIRQKLSRRSFGSSMSRFSPRAFVKSVAEQEGVDPNRAARHTRAVLLALDQALPRFLVEHLHRELAALWGPLTTGQETITARR
jgi:uncharacterized protein (DUF2267 family)